MMYRKRWSGSWSGRSRASLSWQALMRSCCLLKFVRHVLAFLVVDPRIECARTAPTVESIELAAAIHTLVNLIPVVEAGDEEGLFELEKQLQSQGIQWCAPTYFLLNDSCVDTSTGSDLATSTRGRAHPSTPITTMVQSYSFLTSTHYTVAVLGSSSNGARSISPLAPSATSPISPLAMGSPSQTPSPVVAPACSSSTTTILRPTRASPRTTKDPVRYLAYPARGDCQPQRTAMTIRSPSLYRV